MKTPRLGESSLRAILEANNVDQSKVCVLAIRGYYLNSMGRWGENDRKIYDDAMFIIHPDGIERFQANTDPNGYRKGHGKGSKKGMAVLRKGIHKYAKGPHRGRPSFRQAEPFTVIRDGNPPYEDVGWHAINLHSGGFNSTSSLGCQTIPAQTWLRFKNTLYALLEEYKNPKMKHDWGVYERSFDYVLIEEEDRRRGDLIVSRRYL